MADFRNMAKRQTTLSEVMTDRDKISTDDLIAKYPDGVTIVAFDYIQSKKSKGKCSVMAVQFLTVSSTISLKLWTVTLKPLAMNFADRVDFRLNFLRVKQNQVTN